MFSFLLHKSEQDRNIEKFLKNILGVRPGNILLYKVALIHKSCSHRDVSGFKVNNERLEYLGDTVLSTIVGHYLFTKYPHQGEGFLTEMRAKMVSRVSLNSLAKKIGLPDLIEYNKDINTRFASMPGDAFEAMAGALYLDKGYQKTYRALIDRVFTVYVDISDMEIKEWNFKSKIIDWGQKNKVKVFFQVLEISNVDHRKQYNVAVFTDDEQQQNATAFSIKAAEQLAAEKTYKQLVADGVIKV